MRVPRTILVASFAALLAACDGRETAGPSAAGDAPRYVGSEACRPCHAAVADAWSSTRHRAALLPAVPGAPLRAAPSDAGPLVARDGGLRMTAASLAHATDVPVVWALGRRHVEQYVGSIRPGRLQALPRAYDVVRGEWFDLFADDPRAPGDWGHWTNRGMTANAQCLVCHTTGYEKGWQAATDTYESRWSEIGVGCEACHGPGSAHAEARRSGAPDPWVGTDPEHLLDACGACHARRIERWAFPPGAAVADAFAPELLDTDAYWPDGQIKEELYELVSFRQSRMFQEGVRCWNCHDPHADGTRAPGNALCRTCHDARYDDEAHTHHAAGSAGADCRGCHMPTTTYMQRDPRHDHAFLRPDPEATLALGTPNACNRCHVDRDAAWAAERVRAWFPDGAVRAARRATTGTIGAGRQGDASAVPGLIDVATTARDAVHRASAARLLARFPTASGVTTALVRGLDDGEPLVRAASAWALGQRPTLPADARPALEGHLRDPARTVRQESAFALRGVARGDLAPDVAGALRAATAEWRDGQLRLADTPEAHYNLALLYAAGGDTDDAVAAYREALRLWPTSFQARHNLGMLLAQAGRLDEAATEFETVLANDAVPESAFALGLLRAQQGRWSASVAALERCVAAAPDYPRARYNLAVAYAKAGDTAKALDELERAAGDEASHREAVLTLVDLARQVHDQARLERWVLEAARLDPEVQQNPDVRRLLQ